MKFTLPEPLWTEEDPKTPEDRQMVYHRPSKLYHIVYHGGFRKVAYLSLERR